jgi:hypothetical protein
MLKSRQTIRKAHGQGLVEGSVGLILVTMGIVLGTILLMCTGFAINYKAKLQHVAEQASAFVQSKKYWIGTVRDDYNEASAFEKGKQVANEMLGLMGLPAAEQVTFETVKIDGIDYIKTTISCSNLAIPGAGILPSFIRLQESSVSVDHSEDCWGYAMICVRNEHSGRDFLVPCFGYSRLTPKGAGDITYGNIRLCSVKGDAYALGVKMNGVTIDSPVKQHIGGSPAPVKVVFE